MIGTCSASSARSAWVERGRARADRHDHGAELGIDGEVVLAEVERARHRRPPRRRASTRSSTSISMHVAADQSLQLVGGALGDDVAGVDHADAFGEVVGLLHVLRGEHDRRAFAS